MDDDDFWFKNKLFEDNFNFFVENKINKKPINEVNNEVNNEMSFEEFKIRYYFTQS